MDFRESPLIIPPVLDISSSSVTLITKLLLFSLLFIKIFCISIEYSLVFPSISDKIVAFPSFISLLKATSNGSKSVKFNKFKFEILPYKPNSVFLVIFPIILSSFIAPLTSPRTSSSSFSQRN